MTSTLSPGIRKASPVCVHVRVSPNGLRKQLRSKQQEGGRFWLSRGNNKAARGLVFCAIARSPGRPRVLSGQVGVPALPAGPVCRLLESQPASPLLPVFFLFFLFFFLFPVFFLNKTFLFSLEGRSSLVFAFGTRAGPLSRLGRA